MSDNILRLTQALDGLSTQTGAPGAIQKRVATAANVIDEIQSLLALSIKGSRLNTGLHVEPSEKPSGFDELAVAQARASSGSGAAPAFDSVAALKKYLNILIDQNSAGPKQERLATALNAIDDCELAWSASLKGARLNTGKYLAPADVGSDYDETSAALAKRTPAAKPKM